MKKPTAVSVKPNVECVATLPWEIFGICLALLFWRHPAVVAVIVVARKLDKKASTNEEGACSLAVSGSVGPATRFHVATASGLDNTRKKHGPLQYSNTLYLTINAWQSPACSPPGANAPAKLGGYCTKVHQIFNRSRWVIGGVNAR